MEKAIHSIAMGNLVMIAALWYGLTWYTSDVAPWIRVLEVVGLCVIGVLAYAIGLLVSGFRPRDLKH